MEDAAADVALGVAAPCGRWDVGMEVVELMLTQIRSEGVTAS